MREKRTAEKRRKAREKVSQLKNRALERDPLASEIIHSDANASANSRFPVPSTNPATNIMIAEVILRGVSTLLRQKAEMQVAKAGYGNDDRAREVLGGRTIATTLALYGMSKVAVRSPVGLAVVTGGLVAKTLYDRGKDRQARKRHERLAGKLDTE